MVTVNVLRSLCILSSESLMESKSLTVCFCSLVTYFKEVDVYRYQELESVELMQQETLTQLAILDHACHLLVLRGATATKQMMQNVLMQRGATPYPSRNSRE